MPSKPGAEVESMVLAMWRSASVLMASMTDFSCGLGTGSGRMHSSSGPGGFGSSSGLEPITRR